MAFEATHVVPQGGLPAWSTPDGSQPATANLAAGTELRLVEQLGPWAHVEANNGWTGWVDTARLAARSGAATTAVATAVAPAVATGRTAGPQIGTPRSQGREILLYIVSLGIYGFVWTFKTLDEIRRHTGQGVGGVGALVGANPIVAVFLVPYEVRKMYELDGRASPVMGTVGWWFLLVPIAGPFIWFGKVQTALNDYWVSKGAQPV